jgi:serine/threonine-protein kinase
MSWTTERWAAIETLFHDVAQLPPPARVARLDAARAGDPELARAVERLLAADGDGEDELIDRGAVGVLRGKDPLLQARFGPFQLVERIAEGGMGAVYRARRADGAFDQDVAVKVLRLGLSTTGMRERFARERQTLARLVHPNVARLLDGGTTEQGVPFFAMELIDGLPLDRWCDERRASLRQRLQLFATVCRAVHFAHQNLVVHLDLKPNNILVDAHGTPKLLDFGVAGLLEDVTAATGTATRSRPLTPEYASPEQLRGEPLSTAADVYALGVVLYELLCGVRPFRAAAAGEAALLRAVSETGALRPSAAVTTGDDQAAGAERARRRGQSIAGLHRSLRGDLDRIVLMALRKEPQRRYASCQEFADDVERWLRGFPVLAREPSWGYRACRFVQRNRTLAGAIALVAITLVTGIVSTLHMARVARGERDAAEAAKLRVEHEMGHARIEATSNGIVASFLGDTLLSSGLVASAAARDRLRALIQQRAGRLRRQHEGAPHLLANVLDALGRAAAAIDAFADAEALIEEASGIRVAHLGQDSLEHALSLTSLGRLRYQQGRFADAAAALQEAYRLHKTCPHDVHTDVAVAANDLAAAARALGNRDRARELHLEALALRRAGGDEALVAESLNNLANSERDPARQQFLEEALAIRARVLGEDDPLTIQTLANLGRAAVSRLDHAAARPLLRDAVERSRRIGGLGTDNLSMALSSLAYVELQLGEPAAAAAAIDEALAIDRQRFGDAHPRVATDHEIRASILGRRGDHVATIDAWREVLRIRRAALPAGHRDIANTLSSLGGALARAGRADEAIAVLHESLAVYAVAPSRGPADVADAQVNLADAFERAGRFDEAERALLEALPVYEREAVRQPMLPELRKRIAEFYQRRGRPDDAARYRD